MKRFSEATWSVRQAGWCFPMQKLPYKQRCQSRWAIPKKHQGITNKKTQAKMKHFISQQQKHIKKPTKTPSSKAEKPPNIQPHLPAFCPKARALPAAVLGGYRLGPLGLRLRTREPQPRALGVEGAGGVVEHEELIGPRKNQTNMEKKAQSLQKPPKQTPRES